LMAQLRSRGIFSGFIELQQCSGSREWSTVDAVVLQKVVEVLSVVVQQSADQSKIEMDAQEMKLINEIASLFRESRGVTTRDSLVKSVMLVAEHMGFTHSEIYLFDRGENALKPQTSDSEVHFVESASDENPFVEVFKSGRGKMINMEFSRKGDLFFKHDMALVLPLTSEGTRLGVIGLWQRLPNRPDFRPQDRELGLTIAGHMSNVIRADQAIQQIRSDQTRAAIINRVTSGIRKALKEADQIIKTLVEALTEYFELSLCVCALFDQKTDSFEKSETAGELSESENKSSGDSQSMPALDGKAQGPYNLGEYLFDAVKEDLKQGQTIFLDRDLIDENLKGKDITIPDNCQSATLVPLFYAGNFKAALCMVSDERVRPLSDKDEHFVLDLADRVAVVISHAELFTQVEHESITDAMTGLPNRRHFETQLSKEIDRYQRFGHAFSFIIIDLDYLKKINDNLGHQFGDEAIKHIGNVLKKSIRDVDTVGRFGGEEFVVLLPETDLKWAKMVAERICTSIREKVVEGVGTITASLGVAVFPKDADDKEKLFELADKALYLAKQRGRNRVCTVADDLMPSGVEVVITEEDKLEIDNRGREKVKIRLEDSVPSFDLEMIAEKGILGLLAQVVKTLEEKDAYGSERSPRVYGYASRMAQSLHLSKEHAEIVSLAAVLSNLGKIAVPEAVLQKAGPLTADEMMMIQQTPIVGAKILEPAKLLHRVSQIIQAYHEHWDGTGYPNGLHGHDIPVEAQIVSLVDTFTAMTSDRPYRVSLAREEAIELIRSDSGKRWDSRLVKIFLSILQKEEKGE
ncbi:MAG: diguanylate cyclase, partial [Candidatus Obscuribacterales bacterium]|nr:diguanylate cyclase [Candidatus Obscuribacterales bacterium]